MVGAPREANGSIESVGAVFVFAGTGTGLSPSAVQRIDQISNPSPDTPEPGDLFGLTVDVGDLDGDGVGDLVVGAPGNRFAGVGGTGAAFVYYGAAALDPRQGEIFRLDGVQRGASDRGDAFGRRLAVGDRRASGRGALTVAAPFRKANTGGARPEDSGEVYVFETGSGGVVGDPPPPPPGRRRHPGRDVPGRRNIVRARRPPTASGWRRPRRTPRPAAPASRSTSGAAGLASVDVFDALGRRVAVLHDGLLAAGAHTWTVGAAALAPGVYVVPRGRRRRRPGPAVGGRALTLAPDLTDGRDLRGAGALAGSAARCWQPLGTEETRTPGRIGRRPGDCALGRGNPPPQRGLERDGARADFWWTWVHPLRTTMIRALLLVALASAASAQINVPGAANDTAQFGYAVAYGDFNGDGHDDLAIGTPLDGGLTDAIPFEGGSVTVLYLDASGLRALGAQAWVQGVDGLPNADEEYDLFGNALATGDFDGDGYDDLAIGAPGEDIGTVEDAGGVLVVYGSDDGLDPRRGEAFDQGRGDVPGAPERNDFFGDVLAAGDFNDDGRDDLAIGVRNESLGAVEGAGYVQVLYGSGTGLTTDGLVELSREATGAGANQASDRFGRALAVGDADGDGIDDLAIGVAGRVVEVPGSADGLDLGSALTITPDDASGGTAERGKGFGAALAYGDFSGSGRDALAIAASRGTVEGVDGVGAVFIFAGTTDAGSLPGETQIIDQGGDAPGTPQTNDSYGSALGAGDLDGDGFDDLVVGASGKDDGTLSGAGAAFAY